MERHFTFSCREEHAFLDSDEWRIIEPLVKEAQTLSARYGRIRERIGHLPEFEDPWARPREAYNQLTGEHVTNGANLFHRQVAHVGK